jgi:hypothetical protein
MAFSIAAVLILVLSGCSIALIYRSTDVQSNMPLEMAREMSRTADGVSSDLEDVVYSRAIEAVTTSNQVNESGIRERFDLLMADHVSRHYPMPTGAFSVNVNEHNLTLMFMRANIGELYPELEGVGVEYNLSTVPVYFQVVGNLTIVVEGDRGTVIHIHDMDKGIHLPVPLVVDRIDSLARAMESGRCEFENIVRYELSALAQDRVLRGYGMNHREGKEGTSAVLTEGDVLRAVNIALLLETKGRLRSVDPELTSHLEGSWEGEHVEVLSSLSGGEVDPADLFISSYGETEYDPSILLSQCLYSITDNLVLRWMEFFHFLDVANVLESAIEESEMALNEILDRCLGIDIIQEGMINWISQNMASSGYEESWYRYMHYLPVDGRVEMPSHLIEVENELGQTFEVELGGVYDIDFPNLDLLGSRLWGDFQEEYRRTTFQLGETLESMVKRVAQGIASKSPWTSISIETDPMDQDGFMDSIVVAIESLETSPGIQPYISSLVEETGPADPMADSFLRFLNDEWESIVRREKAIDTTCRSIAKTMVEEICNGIPHMGKDSRDVLVTRLLGLFRTPCIGLEERVEEEFDRASSWRLDAMNSSLSSLGGREDLFLDLMCGLVSGVPGIFDGLRSQMTEMVEDMQDCLGLRCDQIGLPMPESSGFEVGMDHFVLGERLRTETGYLSSQDLKMDILYPWDQDPGVNAHVTDPGNLMMAAYSTQWSICIRGDIPIKVTPEGVSELVLTNMPMGRTIHLGTEFTVVTNSGWSLTGVEYTPSSTMMGEIVHFMEGIWDGIVDALKTVANGITGAFSFFKELVFHLFSYSMSALELLSQGLQFMVEGLQGFLMGAAGVTMELLAGLVESLLGTVSFNTTIFGMDFSVQTNAIDLALGTTKDLLKITFSFSVLGTTISISNRLVRLGSGDYDLLVNCTLGGRDWSVSIVVDPLMKMFSHFVEIKGLFRETTLVIYLPEVEEYSTLTVSLGDIPGIGTLLSNIPTPLPGVKASIDAGFEVRFTSPFVNHPVINEYEQNPKGVDRGNEWVELYNPTDEAISLDGWSIGTSHGDQRLDRLSDLSIMPQERIIYTFPGQALDNGGATKFPLCECVVLKDAEGNRVDSTPWTRDHENDGKTWQRSYDGSDRWVFKEGTKGTPNGKRSVMSSEIQFIKSVIWDSVARAFGEAGEMEPSLESLGSVFSRSIDLIRERCIETLASCIVEMRLYAEVALNEYSGSVGAGFSLSLVITGACVRETLAMLADMVIDALTSITNSMGASSKVTTVERLAEHIYIRFTVFGRASLPGMVSDLMDSPEFRMEVAIGVNLACIGRMMGCHFGRPGIEFGVVLTGIPGGMLPKLFAVDMDRTVDVWLMKATLFPG